MLIFNINLLFYQKKAPLANSLSQSCKLAVKRQYFIAYVHTYSCIYMYMCTYICNMYISMYVFMHAWRKWLICTFDILSYSSSSFLHRKLWSLHIIPSFPLERNMVTCFIPCPVDHHFVLSRHECCIIINISINSKSQDSWNLVKTHKPTKHELEWSWSGLA